MAVTNVESRSGQAHPKSVRQKRILEIAADRPKASIESIAREVPTATPGVVEEVLEEYGDPVEETDESPIAEPAAGDRADEPSVEESAPDPEAEDRADEPSVEESAPDPEAEDRASESITEETAAELDVKDGATTPHTVNDLTDKQLETLRAIREEPKATQRELAATLGISAAAVCTRVNAIEGFDWDNREAFVTELVDDSRCEASGGGEPSTFDPNPYEATIDQLDERITALEAALEDGDADDAGTAFEDPKLVHKVLRACFESEGVTKDDELRLLQTVLR